MPLDVHLPITEQSTHLRDNGTYADDTNLLVPEHTDSTLNQEFTHICDWAQQNKMCINITKTKELVFRRPHRTKFDMPCALDGIVQEHVAKLLGVFFSDKLGFEDHVNFVLTVCSQRIYLLKLLKSQDSIYCPDTRMHYIC